mmetsp:Transcript_36549/g.49556  ORF Transcript_36549/g.49556 Transcript_36549/m.49556 type:complete len:96 (-) Transcript_36549:57-344(-)
MFSPTQELKDAAKKHMLDVFMPFFVEKMSKRVEGKKFYGGDKMSMVDFHLAYMFTSPGIEVYDQIVADNPVFTQLVEAYKIEMADYLAARPKCMF